MVVEVPVPICALPGLLIVAVNVDGEPAHTVAGDAAPDTNTPVNNSSWYVETEVVGE